MHDQRCTKTPMQAARLWLAVLILPLVQACASKNVSTDNDDQALMLKGHDPVAYFKVGTHVPGRADIKAEHDGVTYRFASFENRDEFVRAPRNYAPQFGGFCSNGIAYGIPWGGDPDAWQIIDGKLYIFGGADSKKYFLMHQARNVELAHRYWDAEMQDMSSAVLQRIRRLVFRVPHYQTGKELEAEWRALNPQALPSRQAERSARPHTRP